MSLLVVDILDCTCESASSRVRQRNKRGSIDCENGSASLHISRLADSPTRKFWMWIEMGDGGVTHNKIKTCKLVWILKTCLSFCLATPTPVCCLVQVSNAPINLLFLQIKPTAYNHATEFHPRHREILCIILSGASSTCIRYGYA